MFSAEDITEKKKKKGLDKWILSLVHALHSHNPSAPHMAVRQYPPGI
jgi:hypothetical protein